MDGFFGQTLLTVDDSKRVADAMIAAIERNFSVAAEKTPVQGSGLENRMIQALLAERVEFVEDAQALPDSCILKFPNIGRTSLDRLRAWKRSELGTSSDASTL